MEPIAIVGSSCRMPGSASSPSKLWSLLKEPRDLQKVIPTERFNPEGFYNENGEYHGSANVKHSYFLEEDHRVFDHSFFQISPKEAESMDPQQRILLETVFEGIDAGGFSIQDLKGESVAVFVGQMNNDYFNVLIRDVDSAPQYFATGATLSIMSNRVSYFFDWKGPSATIDTACSSSMVALHMAVQALRNGEATMAVAAGVNLILGPEMYIFESKLHMLSPTGRSRMWDANVDGYARGEGFAAVILKPLSQAIADNDNIECIIRETGVNQDGRTKGITMPSATAQAALIRATYARCGLDLTKVEDRPQYFEAHGTGTPAGDPIEAEAIQTAFFPEGENPGESKLYVGSIKTIIGHLEGAAGLAGLLKASMAMKNSIVPPNMLFNSLNPKVKPFYDHLHVPTQALAWPELPKGVKKRASVNSFGFGGTNSHVIIEAWEPTDAPQTNASALNYGPFNISAHSNQALASNLAALAETIKNVDNLSLADLGYTLSRKSQMTYRTSFSASTKDELVGKLEDAAQKAASVSVRGTTVAEKLPLRILGVFTGQGAQWPEMGAGLYRTSELFRKSIQHLEASLAALPDPPSWLLSDQLLAPKAKSHVAEAYVSQPLCTALQVALVDVLREAGIGFSAVVGHSSGEIGAAYAAGHISSWDAIRIAYYRGIYAPLAKGPEGQLGKMMAVGMSLEEATTFCSKFAGRIGIAASNARSSVTLSGDVDAIEEALAVLNEQKTFARLLNVDTAYHSHHMKRCSTAYLDALTACNIQIRDDAPSSTWYSSVYGPNGRSIGIDKEALKGQYWVDNMVQTVLFSQAVARAVTEEHVHDMVLEVGPHPALKGPALETLSNLTGLKLPYAGTLKRGDDDFNAFCDGLGFIWKNFISPKPLVNLTKLRQAFAGEADTTRLQVLKTLPSYNWDHDKVLWKESKKSKMYRTRSEPVHELLGTCTINGQNDEMRWRNVMRLSEMDYMRGHIFQGQTLFPAGGYVAMAFEAAIRLVQTSQPISLVELHDLKISKAVTLDADSAGTEVTFVIRVIEKSAEKIEAEYSCFSGEVDATANMTENANFRGKVTLTLGEPVPNALPARVEPKLPMEPVDLTRLYSHISKIGLDYSGLFMTDSVKRRLDMATVTTKRLDTKLRVHPATLDACFHSIFAAFSWPGDGRLWTSYLPTSIASIRVSMDCPDHHSYADKAIVADCTLTQGTSKVIAGDIDVFCAEHGHAQIQVRELVCSSFTKSRPQDDRKLYAQNVWKRDVASGQEDDAAARIVPASQQSKMAELFERTAYFYLRRLRDQVTREEVTDDWHMKHLMHWVVDHLLPQVKANQHPRVKSEWDSDTEDLILEKLAEFPGQIECELMKAVGDNLPAIIRGEIAPLQVLFRDNMLGKLYTDGLGFMQANLDLAARVSQLAHRYPAMNILEIGAGTGGATRNVLGAIGTKQFASYTYTDISAGFFEKAAEVFSDYSHKMNFKTLNCENDPRDQGFTEHAYDLIIASNVLHATKTLEETMTNCRRLLKPGGHLMLLEITSDALRPQFIVSTLSGWFHGIEDGRQWAPTISEGQWDELLKKTGFSGVDTTVRDSNDSADYCFSVITSQAVDERVEVLRNPLQITSLTPKIPHLVVIGGSTVSVAKIATESAKLLKSIADETTLIDSLDFIERPSGLAIPMGASVICLSDLEGPAFDGMNQKRFNGLQTLFTSAKNLLWITQGARAGDVPYANMIVGLGRSILLENKEINLQFVDFSSKDVPSPTMLAESLVRLACSDRADFQDIFWSTEHELSIENDAVYVPRILPNEDMNNRLNSERRMITEETPLADNVYGVSQVENGLALERTKPEEFSRSTVQIRTEASSAYPFVTSDNQSVYITVGTIVQTGIKVIALSSLNSSVVNVPKDQVFHWEAAEETVDQLYQLIASLISQSIIDDTEGGLWVHQPDEDLVSFVTEAAKRDRVDLFLTTSAPTTDDRLTFVHPYTSKRELQDLVPSNVGTFVNMDASVIEAGSEKGFASLLKSGHGVRNLFENSAAGKSVSLSLKLSGLRRFVKRYELRPTSSSTANAFSLDEASLSAGNARATSVIDWQSSKTVSLPIHPLDHATLFSPNKTHLMVGLTGDLGLSICNWMIQNGARHVVLTSRNPKVDPETLKHLQRKGTVEVKIMAVDASDRTAMTRAVHEIRSTMPKIGGVANAAMVLRDKAFHNLTWEDFQTVLGPKVKGSQILDDLFSDASLEFFVMFSSLACIVGNSGQSNYGAANMFMTSLAYQRRARGLPASVMHIAMLLGVGYVARSIDQYESTLLSKYKYMAISETGFHDMFAEAIVTGRPNPSGKEVVEIITGLSQDSEAPWHENPRFAHYQEEQGDSEQSGSKDSSAAADLKGQLAEATSDEEALAITEAGLSKKLELVLRISGDKIDKGASLINLGIDSLVAVEIRSWFLKELNFDMPVLKILGDTSLTALCRDVVAGRLKGQTSSQVTATDKAAVAAVAKVDWEAEIASLCEGLPEIAAKDNSVVSEKLSVVITGATGFLGKHVVRRLIANDSVSAIHCIAIRRDANGNPRSTGFDSPKIHEYPGDLGEARLGLSEEDFDKLSQTTDAIIHNGADVSFLKSYQALKPTNVLSTKALLTLASPRAVPIHFISTAAVALFSPEKSLPEISAAHLTPPETGERGYALSKWVNEVFLERASALTGVPSIIHRAVNIVGEGAPETDLMTALDTYTKALGATPDLRGNALDGDLDVVEIDEVAGGIVESVVKAREVQTRVEEQEASSPTSDLLARPANFPAAAAPLARPPPTPLLSVGLATVASSSQISIVSSDDASVFSEQSGQTTPMSNPSSFDALDQVEGALVKKGLTTAEELFTIINYCAEHKVPAAGVKGFMEKRLGRALGEIPFATWLEKSADLGMNRLVNFFLQDSLRQGKPIASPCLRKGLV